MAEIIQPKISELEKQFDDLEVTTKDKGERLFDANREVLVHQTCEDIESWMNELESQIDSPDTGADLAQVNILMQKQQVSDYGVVRLREEKVLRGWGHGANITRDYDFR